MCNSAIRYACFCTSVYIFFVPVSLYLFSLLFSVFFLYHIYFEVFLLGFVICSFEDQSIMCCRVPMKTVIFFLMRRFVLQCYLHLDQIGKNCQACS